jgi:Flp pilus assembly protein TadB
VTPALALVLVTVIVVLFVRGEPAAAVVLALIALPVVLMASRRRARMDSQFRH